MTSWQDDPYTRVVFRVESEPHRIVEMTATLANAQAAEIARLRQLLDEAVTLGKQSLLQSDAALKDGESALLAMRDELAQLRQERDELEKSRDSWQAIAFKKVEELQAVEILLAMERENLQAETLLLQEDNRTLLLRLEEFHSKGWAELARLRAELAVVQAKAALLDDIVRSGHLPPSSEVYDQYDALTIVKAEVCNVLLGSDTGNRCTLEVGHEGGHTWIASVKAEGQS